VIYRLKVPRDGKVVELLEVVPAPFPGQGIASDPKTGGLVGIDRGRLQVVFASVALPLSGQQAGKVRVVVWDEQQPQQKQAYDNYLGNAIAAYLAARPGLTVKSVRQDDPQQGLDDATLGGCDVLVWWGHVRQREIKWE